MPESVYKDLPVSKEVKVPNKVSKKITSCSRSDLREIKSTYDIVRKETEAHANSGYQPQTAQGT